MRRKTRVVWIVSGVIVVAGLGLGTWLWASGSSEGTVHVGTPATTLVTPQNPLVLSTPYFSTTLPAGFVINRQSQKPSPVVDFTLVATTSATIDEQFAVTVGTIPSDDIQGNADYNLRITKPDVYVRITFDGLPAGATAFRTRTEPSELTIFWPHNSNYAELACSTSGGATYNQLTAVCVHVLQAWKWR